MAVAQRAHVPVLSRYARQKKIRFFLQRIPREAQILEVGCGSKWVYEYLASHGRTHYVGFDVAPPADVVGDIRDWRKLGLQPQFFDIIIAFEVVEHVGCFQDCYDLLRPGGHLFVTSPIPCMDWALRCLEWMGLSQRRTSPHNCLVDLRRVPCFEHKEVRRVGFLSQWAILTKATA